MYNDAAAKAGKPGKIHGIEGDIRKKVRVPICSSSNDATSLKCLLTRKSEALRLAEEVGKREKHITVLFNNAG